MESLDNIHVNFDPASLRFLNIALAIVMFGLALDMRVSDFMRVVTAGKAAAIGLFAQYILLPAFTYLVVVMLNPPPAIALGLILVAACPGGNISNFLTHHARGDTALAVTLTGVTTAASFMMTPLTLAFWGGLHGPSSQLLREISLDPMEMVVSVFLILGLPLTMGMWLASRRPAFAERMRKPMSRFSLIVFVAMVIFAVSGNYKSLLSYLAGVAGFVFLLNAARLALGYTAARLVGLAEVDCRAISLELGMPNAGLGLILIFNYFDGNGGMAIVAAWWGIWHIISGLILASWWRRRDPKPS